MSDISNHINSHISNSVIIQNVSDSVIIINERGEKVKYNQNLTGVSIDIIPQEYQRREEIQQISDTFENNSNAAVFINGEGGIGKTTIAAKYLQDNENHYKHYVWINAEYGIVDEMLDLYIYLQINRKDIITKNQFRMMCLILNHLSSEGPCLLILDNADNEGGLRDFFMHFRSLNWNILITSRCNEVDLGRKFERIRIEHLNVDKAMRLFRNIYDENSYEFNQELQYFLENIEYNTLLIHLFAKYLREFNRRKKGKHTLKQLNLRFTLKGLFVAENKKIVHDLRKENVNLLLRELYDISSLSSLESDILFQFSFFPLEPIPYVDIEHFFIEELQLDEFDNALTDLTRGGWILEGLNNQEASIKLNSPIIKEFLLDYYKHNIWDKILPQIEYLIKKLEHKKNENPVRTFRWIKYAESLISTTSSREFLNNYLESPEIVNLRTYLGNAYITAGNHNEALAHFQKAESFHKKKIDSDGADLSLCYVKIGDIHLRWTYKFNTALNYYEKAISIREVIYSSEDFRLLSTYERLAGAHNKLGNYQKALDLQTKIISIYKENSKTPDEKFAFIYSGMAETYNYLCEFNLAIEFQLKAILFFEGILEQYDPILANEYTNASIYYRDLLDFESALKYGLKALHIREEIFDSNHPIFILNYKELASIYLDVGNFNLALDYLDRALKLNDQIFKSTNNINKSYILNIYGLVYKSLGNIDLALDYHYKTINHLENIDRTHPDLAIAYAQVAITLRIKGSYKSALKFELKALDIRKERLIEDHPLLVQSYANIAHTYWLMRNYDMALDYRQKVINFCKSYEKFPNGFLISSLISIASIYHHLEDYEEFDKVTSYLFSEELWSYVESENLELATSLLGIESILTEQGEYEYAKNLLISIQQLMKKLLQKRIKIHGYNSHLVARQLVEVSNLHEKLGEIDKSIESASLALNVFLTKNSCITLEIIDCKSNLAKLYQQKSNYKASSKLLEELINTVKEQFGDNHIRLSGLLSDLAWVNVHQGNIGKALEFWISSRKILHEYFDKNDYRIKKVEAFIENYLNK